MPENNPSDRPPLPPEKTLEMRVAELEDKMSKIYITEDEWKAYQKVAKLLGQVVIPRLGGGVYHQGVANPLWGEGGSAASGFGSLGS